jgi:hypothetical protein
MMNHNPKRQSMPNYSLWMVIVGSEKTMKTTVRNGDIGLNDTKTHTTTEHVKESGRGTYGNTCANRKKDTRNRRED